LLLLIFLPSTYTITAISWLPPLISQLFHTEHFAPFYSQAVFEHNIKSKELAMGHVSNAAHSTKKNLVNSKEKP